MKQYTIQEIMESLQDTYDQMKKDIDIQKANGNIASKDSDKFDGILEGYGMAIDEIKAYVNIENMINNKDLNPLKYKK
jgi:hypothetical protein